MLLINIHLADAGVVLQCGASRCEDEPADALITQQSGLIVAPGARSVQAQVRGLTFSSHKPGKVTLKCRAA